jgi:PadR family transcriptional regulator, regulatory protein PadR
LPNRKGKSQACSLGFTISQQSVFHQYVLNNRNILIYLTSIFLMLDSMKGYIGEFEELVLLTIASLGEDAYGVSIKESIENRSDRKISIGALHSTITRLEEKGLIKSWLGEPTQERGGRRKRFFEITHPGKVSLHHVKDLRDELWKLSKTTLSLAK